MPLDENEGGTADPVSDALRFGAAVQDEVTAHDELSDELVERVEKARRLASEAGAYAWGFEDREGLDVIVRRMSRALRRERRPADTRFGKVQQFSGRNPTFVRTSPDDFAALVTAGDPIVGLRFEAPEAHTPLPDLAGVHILDCAFIGWSFDGADLSGSRIIHTVFQGCSFADAILDRAVASTSLFDCTTNDGPGPFSVSGVEANFSGSYLEGCDVRGANFDEASFSYAYLSNVRGDDTTTMRAATFDLASLQHFEVPGADLGEAVFCGSTLVHADVRGADLEGSVFSSAKIAGVHFEGAHLRGAAFRSAYYVGLAHFDGSGLDAEMCEEDLSAIRARLSAGPDDDAELDDGGLDEPSTDVE